MIYAIETVSVLPTTIWQMTDIRCNASIDPFNDMVRDRKTSYSTEVLSLSEAYADIICDQRKNILSSSLLARQHSQGHSNRLRISNEVEYPSVDSF